MKKNPVVAVVGATGAVGKVMVQILEQRAFPLSQLRLVASRRSRGKTMLFKGEEITVEVLEEFAFKGVDIALFSAGAERSRTYAPKAAAAKCVVIDNSSAFRMDPTVPLVVPEVNAHALTGHTGIIANPNCSTIQMVVALQPIHTAARIKRLVVATYQAVSGAGAKAIWQLEEEIKALAPRFAADEWMVNPEGIATTLKDNMSEVHAFPYPIACNLIPQIDVFFEDGYTKEEYKLIRETHKILEDESIGVTATCVRVPVFMAHSEAVNIQTETKLSTAEVRGLMNSAPGVQLFDEKDKFQYPMPLDVAGKDDVYVGRIREDLSTDNAINMWIVGDNLRKGAALNAVQIAECLLPVE